VTSIDFYFNAPDRLQVACRLAGKAFAQGRSLLVYAPDGETASRIDKLLWTWPATGFLPHCALHDALAGDVLVRIVPGPREAAGAPQGNHRRFVLVAERPDLHRYIPITSAKRSPSALCCRAHMSA
jgi:DNA polymerase IIIc chi subunit